ncbi:MAG: ATP synthase F1 subunit delta [Gemmatimonadota bacterium]
MRTSAVSRNYAETLLELARRDGSEEEFGDLIATLGELYEADTAFKRFLNAPSIALEDKKAAVRSALGQDAPEMFVRFLMVVFDRRRHSSLPGIAAGYRALLDLEAGRLRPTVTLAYAPDAELERVIVTALEKRFDRKMIPEFRTDGAILGGMIVRAGDRMLDASVRKGLKDLRRELI